MKAFSKEYGKTIIIVLYTGILIFIITFMAYVNNGTKDITVETRLSVDQQAGTESRYDNIHTSQVAPNELFKGDIGINAKSYKYGLYVFKQEYKSALERDKYLNPKTLIRKLDYLIKKTDAAELYDLYELQLQSALDRNDVEAVRNTTDKRERVSKMLREPLPLEHNFHFTNNCSRPVQLAIRYMNLDGKWIVDSWWKFKPQQSYILRDDHKLVSYHREWYYYAETLGDKNYYWGGDYKFKISGESYGMRKISDDEGDYDWTVTCKDIAPPSS